MGFRDYLSIIRPINCFMTGVGAVFAIMVYEQTIMPSMVKIIVGFLTGFLGCAAPMLINDYIDRRVDAINKPWKPIPSGKVNAEKSLFLSIVFLIIPILINLILGIEAFLTASLYILIGYFYSFLRKHWWSHGIVALSTTAPVVYGYVVAGAPQNKLLFTILFASTMFTVTLGREIVKAIMDIEGDKEYGYITIPIKYGIEKSVKIILLTAIIGPTLGILAGVIGGANILYLILIILAATIYVVEVNRVYKYKDIKEELEKTRKNMLKAMMIGLLAFWLSSINI